MTPPAQAQQFFNLCLMAQIGAIITAGSVTKAVNARFGVTCRDGRVTRLVLWDNQLSSELPAVLKYLTQLEFLVLRLPMLSMK